MQLIILTQKQMNVLDFFQAIKTSAEQGQRVAIELPANATQY